MLAFTSSRNSIADGFVMYTMGGAEAIHIATLQSHLPNGNLVHVAGDNALLLFSDKFNMFFLEIRVT
jgi:hypothetical protein